MFRMFGRVSASLAFFGLLVLLVKSLPLLFLGPMMSGVSPPPDADRLCAMGVDGVWSDEQGKRGAYYKCSDILSKKNQDQNTAHQEELKNLFAPGSTGQLPEYLKARVAKESLEKAQAAAKTLAAPIGGGQVTVNPTSYPRHESRFYDPVEHIYKCVTYENNVAVAHRSPC
jgi:hypothetical protein